MKRSRGLLSVLILSTFILGGCGQPELEERAFPLALAVAADEESGKFRFSFFFEETSLADAQMYHKENVCVTADSYAQALAWLDRAQPAGVDDRHLKVLLLTRELVQNRVFMREFCSYGMQEHHFSWNTYVYLTDAASVTDEGLVTCTGGRPGSYLRDLAEHMEKAGAGVVPTLGSLYQAQYDARRQPRLPLLVQKEQLFVQSYEIYACAE